MVNFLNQTDMSLTKKDLAAIDSLLEKKLAPIANDIFHMKRDIDSLKLAVDFIKEEVREIRKDIDDIKTNPPNQGPKKSQMRIH